MAVTAVGAVPVPVEPAAGTFLLDLEQAAAVVTPRTRALMPVHLYGEPCDLEPLRALARRHGLALVEDAAQAHGARYRGQTVGHRPAPAACFSFYPAKNLGAFGDGGAVVTDDAALAQRLRLLRNYGSARKYHHDLDGINSRLDELQAAFLRVKLTHLDDWNRRRAEIAESYRQRLADVPGLTLPEPASGRDSAWHLFVVRYAERNRLQRHLAERGIGTLIHYPIPPHQSAVAERWGLPDLHLPRAERLARQVLSLPLGPHLDDAGVDAVVAAVGELGGR